MTDQSPFIALDDLVELRAGWRRAGRRVVFTNGAFDLLHAGHVTYLQAARRLGDVLLVGLNSDASVRGYKGPTRPIVPEWERGIVLAALRAVEYVTLFATLTAEPLVAALRPDVYVKGGDYAHPAGGDGKELPEARIVLEYGGQVELIPYLEGLSTSALIARIRA
jgi:rfaE bifunctional protein nucleotidyltransferase chain/domain